MHHFLEVLLRHRSRWAALTLGIPFGDLHLLRADIPLLCVLSVHVTDFQLGASFPVPVFDRAPRLEKVTMHAAFGKILLLPWSQLKSLVLTGTYADDLYDILPLTTNLTSLVADFTVPSADAIMAKLPSTLSLIHLSVLHIRQSLPDALVQLLDKLTLPSLTNLLILSTPDVQPGVVAELVTRSACNMPALHIEIDSWEHTDVDYRALLPTVGVIVVNVHVVESEDEEDSEDEEESEDEEGSEDDEESEDEEGSEDEDEDDDGEEDDDEDSLLSDESDEDPDP
ncbi:hypothetical protein C8R46DRAFT_1044010 [Mycena filopes]|nr:hypothetical protein C8R46DRAFT_1044010 [Mycena filopes]